MSKKYYPYIIFFLVALAAEVFVFNLRFWQSIGYDTITPSNMTCGSGIRVLDTGELYIEPDGDRVIEIDGIDAAVKNVYIDIYDKRCMDEKNLVNGMMHYFQALDIEIYAADEGSAEFYALPARTVVQGVERTKYIKMQTAGKTKKLAFFVSGITDEDLAGQTLVLNGIQFNKTVPFKFGAARLLILFGILAAAFLLRKGSGVYGVMLTWSKRQRAAAACFILLDIFVCTGICMSNTLYASKYSAVFNYNALMQYDELAKSFLNGRLYLDKEPIPALDGMENPYDVYTRTKLLTTEQTNAVWDQAYYKDRFYVYFGALPVLVYYLPCRLFFGTSFMTFFGVLINIYLYTLFVYLLLKELALKRFKNIPFAVYIMLCNVLVFSSGIIFALKKADVYSMPITMAMALTGAGLYCWLVWSDKEKKTAVLAVGSLCMALVSACRPQFLIASFLSVPLFWDKVFVKRSLFSKKSAAPSLAFLLPYVITAAVVMWYNFARFGSVFDFGAAYNLTTNDMTVRGFNPDRIPLGVFAYFLQLPNTVPVFPFIEKTVLTNNYMGITISETMFGGIFVSQPLIWCCMGLKNTSSPLKQKGLFGFAVSALIFSVIVGIADTQMAGVLYRYYMDISLYALLAAAIAAMALCEKYKKAAFAVAVLASLCLWYDAATVFVNTTMFDMDIADPNGYYSIVSAITFWM